VVVLGLNIVVILRKPGHLVGTIVTILVLKRRNGMALAFNWAHRTNNRIRKGTRGDCL